ncbi:MAG: chromosomal replication initiator protein DnaA [Clostridia bacterium]|nr:chromosomal replication initiator protein DnaA [Clostridia bacterium]
MDINNLDSIWEYMLVLLGKDRPDTAVNLWFSDMKLISLTKDEAVFSTTTDIKRDIILSNFRDEIAQNIAQIVGFTPRVLIYSSEHKEADLSHKKVEIFEKIEKGEADIDEVEDIIMPPNYKTEFTFENFVVGESNKFAYAVATAVADKNYNDPKVIASNLYNPLFIYGPSGVGKTHLLYAITNQISKRFPEKKIIYVKGEEFTNQLIDAIQKKTTGQFRDKYRKVDVLLIDDIHFVAGRISTQEELFNTFNAVYEEHKQIILTSDRPPNEIKTLEERLRTRFLSGLLADISLPDYDLRLAILKQKSQQFNLSLSNQSLTYLAENINSSIRQLEGVIKKLGALQLLEDVGLDFERVRNSVKEFVQVKESDNEKMAEIITAVSQKYNITKEDILSSKRNKEIAMARHVCVYIARTVTSLSQAQIGKALNRDRTTIVSSESVVKNEMNNDTNFAYEINDLLRSLQ